MTSYSRSLQLMLLRDISELAAHAQKQVSQMLVSLFGWCDRLTTPQNAMRKQYGR
jgi:hypothetical protein